MKQSTVTDIIRTHVREAMPADMPKAQASFIECLIPALIAGLPGFLDALMRCLTGGNSGSADDYNPGDRERCQD